MPGLHLTFHMLLLGEFVTHLFVLVRLPGGTGGRREWLIPRGSRWHRRCGRVGGSWRRRCLQYRHHLGNLQHGVHGTIERSWILVGGSDEEGGLQDAVVVATVWVVQVGLVEAALDGVPFPEGLVESGGYWALPSGLLGQHHVVAEGVRHTLI